MSSAPDQREDKVRDLTQTCERIQREASLAWGDVLAVYNEAASTDEPIDIEGRNRTLARYTNARARQAAAEQALLEYLAGMRQ
jgi:hypothetical protein